jgi:hypothetical protein
MKSLNIVLASLTVAILLSACGAAPAAPAGAFERSGAEPKVEAPIAGDQAREADAEAGGFNQPQVGRPRLIIKNASLTLIVNDVPAQLDEVKRIAADYNGFVVTQQTSKYNEHVRATVSLRVDSAKLDDALARLRKLSIEVTAENVTGEDVTAEFVDLESNLKNLTAAEAQLQKILEQAKDAEDVLNVFRQLTEVRGQIDTIKGRMKFLNESASQSLITLEMIPDAASRPVEAQPWRPGGTITIATETLIRSLQGLVDVSIFFVIAVLPVLLLMALPFAIAILIVRALIKRRKVAKAS